jgi:bifunctional ADP-heptose synthase (sugar kinase/adenylyltransferase)
VSGAFLVIGESGIDRYIYGEVKRLAPEAPVPVINPTRETNNAGMAGNVVANLVSLGAVRVDSILSDPPITKTRYVDEVSGQMLVRVDENDRVTQPFDRELFGRMIRENCYDALIVADYAKGYLTEDDIAYIALKAKQGLIPTVVDTKKILGSWSKNVRWIKINEREYAAQVKVLGQHPEEFCENLVVTLGRDGAAYYAGGRHTGKARGVRVPVEPISVSDLSGAGDTFCAAFALMITKTDSVTKAMDYANRAARVAVSKRGVVAVEASEVE